MYNQLLTELPGKFNGEKIVFQNIVLQKLHIYMQKEKEFVAIFYILYIYYLKIDHRPKCKTQNSKAPRRKHKTVKLLDDLGYGDDFLDTTSKA